MIEKIFGNFEFLIILDCSFYFSFLTRIFFQVENLAVRRNRLAKKKFVKYHDWPKYKNEQYILIQRAGQYKFLSVWVQSSCDEFSKRMNGPFYSNIYRCSNDIVNHIYERFKPINEILSQIKSELFLS